MSDTGTMSQSATSRNGINRIVLDWLSDAGGAVTRSTTFPVRGILETVEFVPDGGGTAPTDQYDVTLLSEGGVNVLASQGANLSGTVATAICPGVPLKDGTTTSVKARAINDVLQLNVTNAGNAKGGLVILYVRS